MKCRLHTRCMKEEKKETKYKEKIGIGEKIAFMLGGMGGVPLFALISSFLVYFLYECYRA